MVESATAKRNTRTQINCGVTMVRDLGVVKRLIGHIHLISSVYHHQPTAPKAMAWPNILENL
jgi:hypothetical protein